MKMQIPKNGAIETDGSGGPGYIMSPPFRTGKRSSEVPRLQDEGRELAELSRTDSTDLSVFDSH